MPTFFVRRIDTEKKCAIAATYLNRFTENISIKSAEKQQLTACI